jgi:hypothetical protein
MPRPSRLNRPTLSGLLVLLLATPAAAFHHKETNGPATLEARSDHERAALALSDVLRVTVTLDGGKGLRVDTPIRPVPGSGWDVVASSAPEPKAGEDGRVRWRQTLTLAPLAPGEQKLELTSLVFRDGDSDAQTIAWKPFTVPVATQIKDADPAKVRDITRTEDPPAPPERAIPAWLWFVPPLPVLVFVLVCLWLVLRGRRVPQPAPALRKAMRECDRLLAMKLPEKGQCKSFVILLTGILRRYLERRYDLPARRQTTAELLQAIECRADIGDAARRWLRVFLEQADVVKFGSGGLDLTRCSEMVAELRQFCAESSSVM